MDVPRPIKYVVYGFMFIMIVLGFANILNWFKVFIFCMLFYVMYRFLAMSCHHRYTAIPMAIMLIITVFVGIKNLQTVSLLGIAMVVDIFI